MPGNANAYRTVLPKRHIVSHTKTVACRMRLDHQPDLVPTFVGKKQKRRIEDLERWRDMALVLTSNVGEIDAENFDFSTTSPYQSTITDMPQHTQRVNTDPYPSPKAALAPWKLRPPTKGSPDLSFGLGDISNDHSKTWNLVSPDAPLNNTDFDLGEEDFNNHNAQPLQTGNSTPYCSPPTVLDKEQSNSASDTGSNSTTNGYKSSKVRLRSARNTITQPVTYLAASI
jgi:hypothetical protein